MKTALLQSALFTGTLAMGVIAADAAQAASFSFSYTFSDGDVLTGEFEGEQHSDGDTVTITEIVNAAFNGVTLEPFGGVYGDEWESFVVDGTADPAIVSFSGKTMNWFGSTNMAIFAQAFVFDTSGYIGRDVFEEEVPVAILIDGFSETSIFEEYQAANWKLVALDEDVSVPEPSMILGLTAIAGTAALKRRKIA